MEQNSVIKRVTLQLDHTADNFTKTQAEMKHVEHWLIGILFGFCYKLTMRRTMT